MIVQVSIALNLKKEQSVKFVKIISFTTLTSTVAAVANTMTAHAKTTLKQMLEINSTPL